MATLTKYRILQVRSHFSIFRDFAFSRRTCAKNHPKIRSRNRTVKIAQMGPKMYPEPPKNDPKFSEIGEKSVPESFGHPPAS